MEELTHRIYRIYRMIIDGMELTLDNLDAYGITEDNISFLLAGNVIRKKDFTSYEITRPSKLRQYGVKLLIKSFSEETNKCIEKANEYREEAYKCFEKCYELAPRSKEICMQIMEVAVRRKDYDLAFEAFENLLEATKNKGNDNENNLILYLLSL